MQYELPRWRRDDPLTHDQLNLLAEAIERIANIGVDSSSGLQMMETGSQRVLSISKQVRVGSYAKVSGGLSAANGDQLGYGKIITGYKDDSGKFVSYGGDPEDCYTISLTASADGVMCIVMWVDDAWAEVVERCPPQ